MELYRDPTQTVLLTSPHTHTMHLHRQAKVSDSHGAVSWSTTTQSVAEKDTKDDRCTSTTAREFGQVSK